MRGPDLTVLAWREASCHIVGAVGNLKQTAEAWGNVGMIIVDYCELKRCTFIKSYRMADIFKVHEVAIHEVAIHEVGKLKRVFG